jgi:hypothetical protein
LATIFDLFISDISSILSFVRAHELTGFMRDVAYDRSCEGDLFEQRLQRVERGEDYRSSSDKR